MTTIADLAQFSKLTSTGYRERADELMAAYRHERATEMESDCIDLWARVRFADGSEIIVSELGMNPINRHAVIWDSPYSLDQLEQISASLLQADRTADLRTAR